MDRGDDWRIAKAPYYQPGNRCTTFCSVDFCAGIRTRSDQSRTSGAFPSAVRLGPRGGNVVRQCGSQRGSHPNTAPGTVTPWCSSPRADLLPVTWPRVCPTQTLPRTRSLPNLVTDGFSQGRLGVYRNHVALRRRLPCGPDGLDRSRESRILLRRVFVAGEVMALLAWSGSARWALCRACPSWSCRQSLNPVHLLCRRQIRTHPPMSRLTARHADHARHQCC